MAYSENQKISVLANPSLKSPSFDFKDCSLLDGSVMIQCRKHKVGIGQEQLLQSGSTLVGKLFLYIYPKQWRLTVLIMLILY